MLRYLAIDAQPLEKVKRATAGFSASTQRSGRIFAL